jgi:hypothetical protein
MLRCPITSGAARGRRRGCLQPAVAAPRARRSARPVASRSSAGRRNCARRTPGADVQDPEKDCDPARNGDRYPRARIGIVPRVPIRPGGRADCFGGPVDRDVRQKVVPITPSRHPVAVGPRPVLLDDLRGKSGWRVVAAVGQGLWAGGLKLTIGALVAFRSGLLLKGRGSADRNLFVQ